MIQQGLVAEYRFDEGSGQTLWNSKLVNLSIENFIANGNFAGGTTDWTASYAANTAANNTLTNTASGANTYAYAQQTTSMACVNGEQIYVKVKATSINDVCTRIRLWMRFAGAGSSVNIDQQDNPVNGTQYILSGIVAFDGSQTGNIRVNVYHYYADAATATNQAIEIQEFMAINLTTMFGAGAEPTVQQCDAIFASWFDGAVRMNVPKNNGTLGSTTAVDIDDPAWTGQGLSFSVDDYIAAGQSPDFVFGANPHSYIVAVRLTASVAPYNYFIATGNNSNGQQSGIGVTSARAIFVSAYSAPLVTFTTTLSLDTNYILTAVYDGTKMLLYVNGVFVESQAIALNTTVGKLVIGAHTGTTSYLDSGVVYTECVYKNRALTPQEVAFNTHRVEQFLAKRGVMLAA